LGGFTSAGLGFHGGGKLNRKGVGEKEGKKLKLTDRIRKYGVMGRNPKAIQPSLRSGTAKRGRKKKALPSTNKNTPEIISVKEGSQDLWQENRGNLKKAKNAEFGTVMTKETRSFRKKNRP